MLSAANKKGKKNMYAIYDLIKTIVSAFEPDSADEFYWLSMIFELFQ